MPPPMPNKPMNEHDVELRLHSLHVYPIKSCAGITLNEALLIETGLRLAGVAPRLVLTATHEAMLDYAPLAELKKYAIDLN